MTFLKTHLGLILIISLFAVNALIWFSATPLFPQAIESTVGQWHGANIMLSLTIFFYLVLRNRRSTHLFGHDKKSLQYQRFLLILSLLLIFSHTQISYLIRPGFFDGFIQGGRSLGVLSVNLLLGIIFLSLVAKSIQKTQFLTLYRWMFFPFLIATYHAYALSSYPLFSLTPIGVWMTGMFAVGILYSGMLLLKPGVPKVAYQSAQSKPIDLVRASNFNR